MRGQASVHDSSCAEMGADAADVIAKWRRGHRVERSFTRKVDVEHLRDAARPGRHHNAPVGEKYGLGDRMGDEQDGLALGYPEPLQFDVHMLARHGVERSE